MPKPLAMLACALVASAALAGPLNPPGGQPQPSGPSLKDLETKLNEILAGLGARADGERGAINIYMLADGVIGSVTQPDFRDAVQLTSVSLRMGSMMASGGGGSSPVPFLDPIVCNARADGSYPQLFEIAVDGTVMEDVDIAFCGAPGPGQQCYLEVKLENVQITSLVLNAPAGEAPSQSFRLVPEVLRFKYTIYVNGQPQGTITGGWSFATNSPA